MQTFGVLSVTVLLATAMTVPGSAAASDDAFDHEYRSYGRLLRAHVRGDRVDYVALQRDRESLADVVRAFGRVERREFEGWSREQQIAYWVNAYNAFTLQSIVDHYPVDGGWLSFLRWAPRSSIKQIDGVWDQRRWDVAEGAMTLDQIEHETLRVRYDEPRIHFAINCAALSCPPLRPEPYAASRLERQLVMAARDFLASDQGLQVEGETVRTSSVLNWFGDDFVDQYAHLVDGGSAKERAVLGVIATYGPAEASRLAQSGRASLGFLRYDWGLNDVPR